MSHRPERIRIIHELGKPQSLTTGPNAFDRLGSGEHILLMGLGPQPADALALAESGNTTTTATVHYIECPNFAEQMSADWRNAIPAHWKQLQSHDITPALLSSCTTYFYKQNSRLFPSFWGPLLAEAQLQHIRPVEPKRGTRIILPGKQDSLLIRELHEAFTEQGYNVTSPDADDIPSALPRLLAEETPALFFSVNFQGLDMFGERTHLLHAAGIPVCVWCVDVPWHLLSGCKSPHWKDIHLFVTDDSFVPMLKQHGAKHVHHLPLATSPKLFDARGKTQTPAIEALNLGDNIVFVGRSVFPNQQKYFAGLRPDAELVDQASAMLLAGGRPDYHWWHTQMGTPTLWPGSDVRSIGCGAEAAARQWRTACLSHTLECGLTIFGDEAWKEYLPDLSDLREPVDYYTTLPAVYQQAAISLNITSLLLPAGLTQRHFDVWAAGGLLITDKTPGMKIFDAELAKEVVFKKAQGIPALVTRLRNDTALTEDLKRGWLDEILTKHTYQHRVQSILNKIDQ